jgi:hypothetical protein
MLQAHVLRLYTNLTSMSLKSDLFVVALLPLKIPACARIPLPAQTDITYRALDACTLMKAISDAGVLSAPVTGSGIGPRVLYQQCAHRR